MAGGGGDSDFSDLGFYSPAITNYTLGRKFLFLEGKEGGEGG